MHILLVPSAYPTIENPLSSIFYKEQALAIKDMGNKVGVIFSETRRVSGININSFKKNHFQIRRYIEDELVTYRLHGWNIFTMRGRVGIEFWVNQSLKLFEEYIKSEGMPDLIHVHSALYGGLVGKKIKEKYNIPYIITEHSSAVLENILRSHDIAFLKEAYNNTDGIISVGSSLKNAVKTYTNKNIKVIPNIVDVNKFNISKKNNKDTFTFISICHLKDNKGVNLTIEAFAKAFRNNHKVNLIIVGDGPEKNNLINQCVDLKIKDKVNFVGAIGRDKINSYLKRSDAFVLPSKYETFGIVYIEALACGLPIIATKCGGPEDFFKDELGYMIPINDIDALEKSMIKMVENIETFNKNNLSEYVKERFSKETIAKKVIDVYKEVLGK